MGSEVTHKLWEVNNLQVMTMQTTFLFPFCEHFSSGALFLEHLQRTNFKNFMLLGTMSYKNIDFQSIFFST